MWKGVTTPGTKFPNRGIGKFSGDINIRYTVEGNVMSLLFGDNFKGQVSLSGKNYAFYELFNGNKNITSAKNLSLPATTLANSCYYGMFSACTSLITAPELPATTLANDCYSSMFLNCTSLTTAPELPATILVDYCYTNMFGYCTNLSSIKCLATDNGATMCTYEWVRDVATNGTFTKAASKTWPKGVSGIPEDWDVVDA